MSVELRHLRALEAVAEELNFTRAAARLHLAQQALSAQIRQLEERVGTRLFERSTRHVALTPAGEALLAQARPLLVGADQAVAAARAAAAGTTSLVVGFAGTAAYATAAPVIAAYEAAFPEVELRVRFGSLTEPAGGMGSGEPDVGWAADAFDDTGFELVELLRQPLGVTMRGDHPLTRFDVVPTEAYVAQPTFRFLSEDPRHRGYWSGAAYRRGKPPRYVADVASMDGLREALLSGRGVALTSERFASTHPDLTWRPVEGVEPIRLCLVLREGEAREPVRAFVDLAVRELRAEVPSEG